jgi:hypothetical protein
LAGIDGILEYGASLFRRKMMKGRKHRSKALQLARDFHRVDRVRVESNAILSSRSGLWECAEVGVFIRKQDVKDAGIGLELSRKA